jgi:hypothetical protein
MSRAGYECTDRAGDAAAYALGALAPHEAEAFLRHTESCVVCRDELHEFGLVAGALALAVPQYQTPQPLRRAVLRELTGCAPVRDAAARRPASRPGWRSGPRLAAGLAALALTTAGAVTLAGHGAGARDVQTLAAQVHGVTGTAELRLDGAHADLVVHDLPQPAAGHIYEVWTEHAHGGPQPTSALFGVTSRGDGVVEIPGDARSLAEVLVTQEPAGGSLEPSTEPVVVAPLS